MAVNNFKGTVNIINGNKKTVYEMAQVPATNANIERNFYRGIPSTIYTQGMSTRIGGSYTTAYAGYDPGEVYIPKKHLKLEEFIPLATVKAKIHEWIMELPNPIVDQSNLRAYMDVEHPFIWDEENNVWGCWTFCGNPYASRYNGNYFANVRISLYLFGMDTTYSMLSFERDNGNYPTWVVNGPDGKIMYNDGKYIIYRDAFVIGFDVFTAKTQTELIALIDIVLDNYYKFNVYFVNNTPWHAAVYDNIGGFRALNTNPNNNALTLTCYLLFDSNDAPNFQDRGFIVTNVGNISTSFYPQFATLKWGSGPSNNNPENREDDPNDDDKKPNPDDKGGDGDHDDTDDKISKPNLPTLSASQAGLITIFNPSISELREISGKLWSPDAWEAIKQYFTTPLGAVLGLGIIPVAPVTSGRSNVFLGLYDTEVSANVVGSDYVIVDCGSIPITRYYGSYLDYSPYTHIKCYLPYIGEIDISPDEAMQKTLNIQYYINVVTGDTVAMCLLDGDLFYTATGNCVRQLPLSSADYSAIINTAVNAVSTIMTAAATADVGAAAVEAASARPKVTEESKKLASAQATANNVGSSTSLLNNITGAKMRYNHAGSMGTGAGQLCRQKPYLIIERPNLDLASNYKGFVGYPCNKTKQISSCKGYTQIEASNIAVANATDVEVSMIKEILMEGVIL